MIGIFYQLFITKLFYPENSDDVIGYLEAEKVVEIANNLFKNYSFQES